MLGLNVLLWWCLVRVGLFKLSLSVSMPELCGMALLMSQDLYMAVCAHNRPGLGIDGDVGMV